MNSFLFVSKNPKGLRLTPLISSAFPPLCKFSSSHSRLFLCFHIACLRVSIMGTKLLNFTEYSAKSVQKMLKLRRFNENV